MGVRGKILAAGEVNLGFRAELVLDSREPAYVSSLKAALRIMEFIRGEGTSISLTKSATPPKLRTLGGYQRSANS